MDIMDFGIFPLFYSKRPGQDGSRSPGRVEWIPWDVSGFSAGFAVLLGRPV